MVWDRDFGGQDYECGYSVQQTSDGGYIVAGDALSPTDYDNTSWVIKTDTNGNMVWDSTFGSGLARSIQQTSDGGYVVAGETRTRSKPDEGDAWIAKTCGP